MTRTPLRRTKRLFVAIAAVAMLALSFTAVASAVDPSDNSGTVKTGETRADPDQCKNYKKWYDDDVKAGDAKEAAVDKQRADDRGCRWAERIVGPATQPGTVTTPPTSINPGPVTTQPIMDWGSVTTTPD